MVPSRDLAIVALAKVSRSRRSLTDRWKRARLKIILRANAGWEDCPFSCLERNDVSSTSSYDPMAESSYVIVWLLGGLAIILLEIVLPGGIAFFLGMGALLVALLLYLGVVEGILQALMTWFIGSLVLIFTLRESVSKIFPSSVERTNTDEDLDAYHQVVGVSETIPAKGEGRIDFRGSTWTAKNYHQDRDLVRGEQVRIIFRENLVWLVEAQDEGQQK